MHVVNVINVYYPINCILTVEQNTSALVTQLLELSEKSRRTEELVEQMERERLVLKVTTLDSR